MESNIRTNTSYEQHDLLLEIEISRNMTRELVHRRPRQ